MNNYSKMYWFTRLDNLNDFLILVLILSALIAIISAVVIFTREDWSFDSADTRKRKDEMVKTSKKWLKRLCFIFGIIALLKVFVPTKTDMVFIIVGGKTMNFVDSDTSINKIPAQTTKIITDYLETKIKEIK